MDHFASIFRDKNNALKPKGTLSKLEYVWPKSNTKSGNKVLSARSDPDSVIEGCSIEHEALRRLSLIGAEHGFHVRYHRRNRNDLVSKKLERV